jgi:serine/threonine protein kinase
MRYGLNHDSEETTGYRGPGSAPAPAELAPLFPQLEILELLGRGGMGAVYKARQLKLDRFVALKILPPDLGREAAFAERFAREARALARLNHPQVVAVHDFGESGGLYYLVMEFVDGVNLRQLLQAGQLEPARALQIVPQICEALQYAHEEGVVHRDIKPENILLDKRGRVKIADFGLAKLLGHSRAEFSLTGSQQVMGTLDYMAPEQRERPLEVDQRADIYSLGVVFYEMLTGELPLGRFAPPSQKSAVDARLDAVVLRALERHPQQRYQRVSDLKVDVEALSVAVSPANVLERKPIPKAISLSVRTSYLSGTNALGAAQGVLRLQEDGLHLELIWQGAQWHERSWKIEERTAEKVIPFRDLRSVTLKEGWWAIKLVLAVNRLSTLQGIPQAAADQLLLLASRSDRETAEQIVAGVAHALSEENPFTPAVRTSEGQPKPREQAPGQPRSPQAEKEPERRSSIASDVMVLLGISAGLSVIAFGGAMSEDFSPVWGCLLIAWAICEHPWSAWLRVPAGIAGAIGILVVTGFAFRYTGGGPVIGPPEMPLLSRALPSALYFFALLIFALRFMGKSRQGEVNQKGEGSKPSRTDSSVRNFSPREKSVHQLLDDYHEGYGLVRPAYLLVLPNLPAERLGTARKKCLVPPTERILGLLDLTYSETAECSLVFGVQGVYYCNHLETEHPGVGTIPYGEFAERIFVNHGQQVYLGKEQFLCPEPAWNAYYNLGCEDIANLLNVFRQAQLVLPSPAEEEAPQKAETQKQEKLPEPASPGDSDWNLKAEKKSVHQLLENYSAEAYLLVSPNIPADRLGTARKKCRVPPTEHILGLVDLTYDETAECSLLFGVKGIYYRNHEETEYPEVGAIPYGEFPERVFVNHGQQVYLGKEQFLCPEPAWNEYYPVGCEDITNLLNVFRQARLAVPAPVEVMMEAPRKAETQDQEKLPEPPSPSDANLNHRAVAESVHQLLENYPAEVEVLLLSDIPADRLATARKTCVVPPGERIVGLLDLTCEETAACSLLFGVQGIYYCNHPKAEHPGAGAVPYREFPERTFVNHGQQVFLGKEQYLCPEPEWTEDYEGGCEDIANLLNTFRQWQLTGKTEDLESA